MVHLHCYADSHLSRIKSMGYGRVSVSILYTFTKQQWILLVCVCVYTEYKLADA